MEWLELVLKYGVSAIVAGIILIPATAFLMEAGKSAWRKVANSPRAVLGNAVLIVLWLSAIATPHLVGRVLSPGTSTASKNDVMLVLLACCYLILLVIVGGLLLVRGLWKSTEQCRDHLDRLRRDIQTLQKDLQGS